MDVKNRPDEYDGKIFTHEGKTKIKVLGEDKITALPIITQSVIDASKHIPCTETRLIKLNMSPLAILSCPVLVTSAQKCAFEHDENNETKTRMINVQESLLINCLCIDDVSGSLFEWCKNSENRSIQWNITSVFTRAYTSLVFDSLNTNTTFSVVPIIKLQEWITVTVPQINLFEATFVPDNTTTTFQ